MSLENWERRAIRYSVERKQRGEEEEGFVITFTFILKNCLVSIVAYKISDYFSQIHRLIEKLMQLGKYRKEG